MKRNAFTLLEMAVSLTSSIVLVAGLASAIYISSHSLPSNDNASRQSYAASAVLYDLTTDVSLALSFSERTARAITFTVPDRNGDSLVETIRYAWTGTPGDPLTYQYNGGTVVSVATDVQAFNLEVLTRLLLAESLSAPLPGNVVYEECRPTKRGTNVSEIPLDKPLGTVEGNLLIAAVALDGNAFSALAPPTGWTLIRKGPQGVSPINQTFGVWWKIATSTEPGNYPFTWTAAGGRQAYGWVMRFTGHDPTNPIHASAMTSGGMSLTITSPLVTTSVENAMIVRLAGFDGRGLPVALTSLLGHTWITSDSSSTSATGACAGAAGHRVLTNPGNSGTSLFVLALPEEYTTVTLAIAPGPPE